MDIWSWISNLPDSTEWPESNSPLFFHLTPSSPSSSKSILLKAERSSGSNPEALVTFSICLNGFHFNTAKTTLWVSDTCPLSSSSSHHPFLPLLLQLLQELISRAPTSNVLIPCRTQSLKLKPDPVSWILESHSPESFADFFNLVFLSRLFWLCVCDSDFEVGELYFQGVLTPNIHLLSCGHVARNFLIGIGLDAELCFMRTLGYILAKWLMLRDVGVGLQLLSSELQSHGFSYAMESHGLWILKGYAPVLSMTRIRCSDPGQGSGKGRVLEAKESVLRYVLGHQQLEAVIQLEYSVSFDDTFIQVKARVDNLRLHMVKFGFNKLEEEEDGDYAGETYFPSRIRVWVGPEIGSTYVGGLSLSKPTPNPEKEVENQKIVEGNFGKEKTPTVKATATSSTRTKTRGWRWEQDSEGNAVVFEAALCDQETGIEISTWNSVSGGSPKNGLRKRYTGGNRIFNKTGGLILAGDEYGEWVTWRVSKEMEGSVLRWRLGGKIWMSYWANNVKSDYYETRCVDWCEEVDLPLIQ